jgi:hypothetical protein
MIMENVVFIKIIGSNSDEEFVDLFKSIQNNIVNTFHKITIETELFESVDDLNRREEGEVKECFNTMVMEYLTNIIDTVLIKKLGKLIQYKVIEVEYDVMGVIFRNEEEIIN